MSQHIEDRLNELKSLPPLEPPAALEATTLAAMAAAAEPRGWNLPRLAAAWGGIAVAAALLALAVGDRSADEQAQSQAFSVEDPGPDAGPVIAPEAVDPEFAYLMLAEQSAYLEGLLAALPQRDVMRVSTAGTIVGLEQQVALIDAVLRNDEARAAPTEYRVALMRDRVQTMNALVNVRYAQSRAFYH